MEADYKLIASNILRHRKIKGLKQEDVAEKAGISRNAYRAIELGKSVPRVDNLSMIASVLGVKLPTLFRKPETISSLRFRASGHLAASDRFKRSQVILDFALWLKDFNFLEEVLNDRKPYEFEGMAGAIGRNPEQTATAARKRIGLKDNEAIHDICGLLEAAGVKVYPIDSDLKKFFGFSVAKQDGGPAICVNTHSSISVERQIYTAAHEFGHLLLHPDSFNAEIEDESEAEEKDADIFASYFLMPQVAFKKIWDESRGMNWVDAVIHVKRRFKVSYKTVLYRLVEIHGNSNLWMRFNIDYKKRHGESLADHKEPQPIIESFKEPHGLEKADFVEDRFSRLVRDAFEKEEVTTSRAAELLRISLMEMRERAVAWRDIG